MHHIIRAAAGCWCGVEDERRDIGIVHHQSQLAGRDGDGSFRRDAIGLVHEGTDSDANGGICSEVSHATLCRY